MMREPVIRNKRALVAAGIMAVPTFFNAWLSWGLVAAAIFLAGITGITSVICVVSLAYRRRRSRVEWPYGKG
jgi:hypothetical protein